MRYVCKILASAILILTCSAVWGQSTTSSLIGTIVDSTGALVPGASVTVTNKGTSIAYRATVDAQGVYRISQLPPGTYTVQVTASGFQTYNIQEITLQVDQQARQDIALSVGQSSQTVEVSGTAPLLDTVASNVGQVVEPRQIQDLPLNGPRLSPISYTRRRRFPDCSRCEFPCFNVDRDFGGEYLGRRAS